MTATATTTTTTTATTATTATKGATKGATMVALRSAMPQYFTLSAAGLIKSLSDKAQTVTMLAQALTGAAIERAQSGNTPALSGADSALETVKGKALRQRVDNALSIVRAVKSRGMSAATVADYEIFASETYSQLCAALMPPAPTAKPATAKPVSWKERAERAEAAHSALLTYAETLRAMLGAKAPALPVGVTLPTADTTTA